MFKRRTKKLLDEELKTESDSMLKELIIKLRSKKIEDQKKVLPI